jgi:hypothetical protein
LTQYIAETPLHVNIRSEVPALYDSSGRMVAQKKRRVFADFRRGEAPAYAYEVGRQTFEFRGMPGGVTMEQWMAYYDSEEDQIRNGWTDEERGAIEEKLATRPGVVVIEAPRIPAPWPGYNKLVAHGRRTNQHVAEKVAEMTKDGGYDVKSVIAYEMQEFGRNEVIAALNELLAPAEEPAEAEVLA